MKSRRLIPAFVLVLLVGVALPAYAQNSSGYEGTFTVTDDKGRTVEIQKPVRRIIPFSYRGTETLIALGAKDRIIAVSSTFKKRKHPIAKKRGMLELPTVGTHAEEINFERIIQLDPDLIIMPTWRPAKPVAKKLPETPVLSMDLSGIGMDNNLRTMGRILGKQDRARQLLEWMEAQAEKVNEAVDALDLSKENKPKFYFEAWRRWKAYPPKSGEGRVANGAGGRNICVRMGSRGVKIQPEFVVGKDPSIMVRGIMYSGVRAGWGQTEQDMKQQLKKVMEGRGKAFKQGVKAVAEDNVYLMDRDLYGQATWPVGRMYFAKIFYPGQLPNLHPKKVQEEYYKKFLGINVDVDSAGTWIYPWPPKKYSRSR